MKRRVGFARAIALKPRILLFDEPTTGLDPVMTDVIGRIILDLKAEMGVTSITVTHDLKSAFENRGPHRLDLSRRMPGL